MSATSNSATGVFNGLLWSSRYEIRAQAVVGNTVRDTRSIFVTTPAVPQRIFTEIDRGIAAAQTAKDVINEARISVGRVQVRLTGALRAAENAAREFDDAANATNPVVYSRHIAEASSWSESVENSVEGLQERMDAAVIALGVAATGVAAAGAFAIRLQSLAGQLTVSIQQSYFIATKIPAAAQSIPGLQSSLSTVTAQRNGWLLAGAAIITGVLGLIASFGVLFQRDDARRAAVQMREYADEIRPDEKVWSDNFIALLNQERLQDGIVAEAEKLKLAYMTDPTP